MFSLRQLVMVALVLLTTVLWNCREHRSPKEVTMASAPTHKTPKAPVADRVDHPMVTHGHTRQDPYYWLRDDARTNEKILAYLKAENTYTTDTLAHTEKLQTELFEEIKGRIKKDDASVPYFLNGYWYYTRHEASKEYPIHCRRKGDMEAAEEVVLDVNIRAKGQAYYANGNLKVSPDNALIAFSEDTLSRRIYTIRLAEIASGKLRTDEIQGTSGNLVWAQDNQTLFYVRREPKTLRAHQVWRHTLGTESAKDVLVFDEKDDTFYVSIRLTKSRRYIVIRSQSTLVTEEQVLDAAQPTRAPRTFLPREANHEYGVDHGEGDFLVRTNWDATNFRLMSVPLELSHEKTRWKEVIPARETVFLHDFELFSDYLVVSERENGLRGLRVLPKNEANAPFSIDMKLPLYVAHLGVNPEYQTRTLRFELESLTVPDSVYDYDMKARTLTLKKQQAVLGGFDAEAYTMERLWAPARDGAKVPISLVYRKDLDRSKPQPLYQYGYGSYGYSIDPSFGAARLSLLDRGFIFAIAHIRGGQEMGRAWYENGKLLKKLNTFTDFIDVGKHLIEKGYTSSDQLIAVGGSAGGLLVGAVANMAPEQYHAIVARVPFVDVVTTMLDESIPLTTFEYDEWGNPNKQAYYEYMLSYSPYDQVKAQDYPHMLVMTGLHDSQVQYWEPAKWVAKLRHHKTDSRKLLFLTNMEAGHGGASGRFKRYKELAVEYAFLLDVLKR